MKIFVYAELGILQHCTLELTLRLNFKTIQSSKMNATKHEFGIEDKLQFGLKQVKDSDPHLQHPIETSEKLFQMKSEEARMEQLRMQQGFNAPLKIQMEKRLVSGNGHLPCITNRSNFSRDVLEDNDSTIAFGDVLGRCENFEGISQPHDVIEASLAKNAFAKGYSAHKTSI